MKPVRKLTDEERTEVARKFDNLHVRPHTDDWEFWDMLGEVDRLKGDRERNDTMPISDGEVPHMKGKSCLYKSLTCQEDLCIRCGIYENIIIQAKQLCTQDGLDWDFISQEGNYAGQRTSQYYINKATGSK